MPDGNGNELAKAVYEVSGKMDIVVASIGRSHKRIDVVERDMRSIEKTMAKHAVLGTLGATIGSALIIMFAQSVFAAAIGG